MREKTIFLDFDDTIIDTAEAAYRIIERETGIKLDINNHFSYNIFEVYDKQIADLFTTIVHRRDFYYEANFYDSEIEILKAIKDKGYKIKIWTRSRDSNVDVAKKEKIEELPKGLIDGYISFNGAKASAGEGIYIDDSYGNLENLQHEKILIKRPWNVSYRHLINSVNTIQEIYDKL